MYKNPLNNGDISDYNSLKKQIDKGSIVKKYQSKKLETKPTELQKYYQYQTYQQPILDELNYVAERMRTEDIKKKTEDYDFIENLKIKRETLMKETSKKETDIGMRTLFNKSSLVKQDDMTPSINTDIEMEILQQPEEEEKQKAIIKIQSAIRNKNAINKFAEKFVEKQKASVLSQAETQQEEKPKKKGGRPKGSKNTPKKTLDLTK